MEKAIVYFIVLSGIISVLVLILALFRNDWVYSERTKLIYLDFDKYKKLEDYNTMLFRFWIWNIEKFIKDSED